ncbi:low specificity L-threonine aldolase [Conexibacter sp. S30A1]|jgi:threonine aldolase|uniref:threonine aldolase family protein n=1 Tax=Conexibacter sp. S30A1 TaxID=2937800 RepID=UPI00200D25C1|nr:beta-eliminating lyase-related protein [Conexibacter sp. S30A1]
MSAALARRGFASDNAAGVHPRVLEAIAACNRGHAYGYGHDRYTQAVERRLAQALGAPDAAVFFVLNGSGANVLSLRAALRPWEAAVVSANAHLHTDEVGAPEAVAGTKLLVAQTCDGRVTLEGVRRLVERSNDEHSVKPGLLSLTQSTELGTLYEVGELRELAQLAHDNGLRVHVDGARFANAAAALGLSLAELLAASGADLLSFGGTKNGLMLGEAVVVLDPALAPGMLHLRKQTLQLASKMRFVAAQFDALLDGDLWLENAAHANAMARRLHEAVGTIEGVRVSRPPAANAVFAVLPTDACERLQREFDFYVWDEHTGEVRWMCSWDTTEQDVDSFARAVQDALR